jgi:hypothetical protein
MYMASRAATASTASENIANTIIFSFLNFLNCYPVSFYLLTVQRYNPFRYPKIFSSIFEQKSLIT